MKKKIVFTFLTAVIIFISNSCNSKINEPAKEQNKYVPISQDIYDTIVQMDSVMFAAFNAHNAEKLMVLFSDSLEFYHDNAGLSGYEQTKTNFTNLFQNEVTKGIHRTIVEGSLEVYPINNYGALETGLHTFCHEENGKQICGTFKFIHLWQKKEGQWRVTRVISYDH